MLTIFETIMDCVSDLYFQDSDMDIYAADDNINSTIVYPFMVPVIVHRRELVGVCSLKAVKPLPRDHVASVVTGLGILVYG